jgi:Flp pilus assembly protein CpaB
MSIRTILVVLLALVCGLSAAFGVQRLVRNGNREVVKTTPVVMATTEISRFGYVTADMLTVRQVPVDLAPKGALKTIEEAKDRVALNHLSKQEILLDSQLAKHGSGLGMAAAIPKGMRGFTIQPAKISG